VADVTKPFVLSNALRKWARLPKHSHPTEKRNGSVAEMV